MTTRLVASSLHLIRGNAKGFERIAEFAECTTGVALLMLTLAFALLGGLAAAALHRTATKRRAIPANTDVPGPPRRRGKAIVHLALWGLMLTVPLGAVSYFSRPAGRYFPALAFVDEEGLENENTVSWYSKHLRAMGEPSLWNLSRHDRSAVAYRMTWLPLYNHSICVRIYPSGKTAALRIVVLDGLGVDGDGTGRTAIDSPGQPAIDRRIALDKNQWDDLERRLEQIKFWGLPARPPDDRLADGDQLIVEAVKDGKYHITDRAGPGAEYLGLCRHFLQLSGVAPKAFENYH